MAEVLNKKPIYVGDDVKVRMTFKDIALGTLVDPTSVTMVVTSPGPDPVVTTQVFPSGTIARDSLGTFHALIDANRGGKWRFKVTSTGPGKAGRPGSFLVSSDDA